MIRRFLLAALAACVLFPLCVRAEESAEDIQSFLRQSAAARPKVLAKQVERLAEAEAKLAAAKRAKIVNGGGGMSRRDGKISYTLGSVEIKKQYIERFTAATAQLKRNVELLKSGKGYPIFNSKLPFEVGGFASGHLVMQVIQVVDEKNCIVQFGPESTWWLEGVDTEGVIDGRKHQFATDADAFFVAGTRRYSTAAGGTRTIPMLRPFSLDDVRKQLGPGEEIVPDTLVEPAMK